MYLRTSSSGVSSVNDIEIGSSSFSMIFLVLASRSKRSTALPQRLIRFSEMYRHHSASGYSIVWVSGNGIDARVTSCIVSRKRYFASVRNCDLLGVEAHRVGDELAGAGSGVVVAVGERAAPLQGVGLLGQQPGFGEGGRGDARCCPCRRCRAGCRHPR